VNKALLVFKDHRAFKVNQVHKGQQAQASTSKARFLHQQICRRQAMCKVMLILLLTQVTFGFGTEQNGLTRAKYKAQQGHKDLKVYRVNKESKEVTEFKDHKESKELLVQTVQQVPLVHRVTQEFKEFKVTKAQ
jgi:hypothetical protein